LRLGGVVGGEELEEVVADGLFALVDDGVAATFDEDLGIDEAGEGDDLAGEFEGVAHGE
jgi:hypothetical protein